MECSGVTLNLQALDADATCGLALDAEVGVLLAAGRAHLLRRELQQLHPGGRHDGRRLALRLRKLIAFVVVSVVWQIGTALKVRGLPDLLIAFDRLRRCHVRFLVLQCQRLDRLRVGR